LVDKGILRNLTLEAFLRSPQTQFESLKRAVAQLAAERGLLETGTTGGAHITYHEEQQLPTQDQNDLQEVVWDLIVERVLTPGIDAHNPEWPWLRMTERGKRLAGRELGEGS
jgi:hypothetical protein